MTQQTINEVLVPTGEMALAGSLAIPGQAAGMVIFAHGSGSSRFSSRNRFVAEFLNQGALATLLFDLLTAEEHQVDQYSRRLRFDIPLLAERLSGAVDWIANNQATRELRIGLFGSSTGAAAALITAASRPALIAAVVSRGGRPDLAAAALPMVAAPTLLIVGGDDYPVIKLNREAAARLRTEHRMDIIPGATHQFEEPGKLEEAAALARNWFKRYLKPRETQ